MSSDMSPPNKKVLVIGGTGAQGIPTIKALTHDGAYSVVVLTRNVDSTQAKELSSMDNVSVRVGDVYSEHDLREALQEVSHVFANTNGFAIGEKAEIYWGIRMFELARERGIEWFVWSNLDYALKKGNYDPKFRVGHYDGKGKVAEWIQHQPTKPMAWTIFTNGPYMEMLNEFLQPQQREDGTFVFAIPIDDGAMAFIHLDDLGAYVRWIFDNPSRSVGMDLEVATQHVHLQDLVQAFQNVTGKPAIAYPIPVDQFVMRMGSPDKKAAHSASDINDPTLMTLHDNFRGFFTMWKHSGGNQGVVRRDYRLLDEILPSRVKDVEEWMRKTGYTGEKKPVLKDWEDMAREMKI